MVQALPSMDVLYSLEVSGVSSLVQTGTNLVGVEVIAPRDTGLFCKQASLCPLSNNSGRIYFLAGPLS